MIGLLWGCSPPPPPAAPVASYDIASAEPAAQVSLGHLLGTGRAHGVGDGPEGLVTFHDGVLYVSSSAHPVQAGTPYGGTAQRLLLSQVPAWAPARWDDLPAGPFRFSGTLEGATASDACGGAGGPPEAVSGVVVGVLHAGQLHAHLLQDGRAQHLVDLGTPGAGQLWRGVSR